MEKTSQYQKKRPAGLFMPGVIMLSVWLNVQGHAGQVDKTFPAIKGLPAFSAPAGITGQTYCPKLEITVPVQKRYDALFQDTLKKHKPTVEVMTWDEIRHAQIESMQNLQEALRLAQDSLRAFNRQSAEAIRKEMEKARQAYIEAMEQFHSQEFRQEMENIRNRIETYHFPEDSLRKALHRQMEAFHKINWDSIYRKMEKARLAMEEKIRAGEEHRMEAMEEWHKQMEEALKNHEKALRKQEELLEQLEKEDQQEPEKNAKGEKRKKTEL